MCYRTWTTADKREIKDFPKLPVATSFIRKRCAKLRARLENDKAQKETMINKQKKVK